MNKEYSDQEYIDLYIQNKLSSNERISFEERLEGDKELQGQLQLTQYLSNAFFNNKVEDTLNSFSEENGFQSIISRMEQKNKKKSNRIWLTLLSTAAVALLLVYIGIRPQYSKEELYADYYSVPTYEPLPMRGGDLLTLEQEEQIKEGFEFYEKKDFRQALNIFNIVTKEIEDIPEDVLFYSSICMIEIGKAEDAVNILNYLSDSGNVFAEDAKWNLALLYLKEGKQNNAKVIFESLAADGRLYKQSSIEILKKTDQKRWF